MNDRDDNALDDGGEAVREDAGELTHQPDQGLDDRHERVQCADQQLADCGEQRGEGDQDLTERGADRREGRRQCDDQFREDRKHGLREVAEHGRNGGDDSGQGRQDRPQCAREGVHEQHDHRGGLCDHVAHGGQ